MLHLRPSPEHGECRFMAAESGRLAITNISAYCTPRTTLNRCIEFLLKRQERTEVGHPPILDKHGRPPSSAGEALTV
jgi:hypothetical protein